jgi:hypothetical protein
MLNIQMQYWIFFWGGVGGDGFSNLIEHANNITPCDGEHRWRTRNAINGKIAFKGPRFSNIGALFRSHVGFDMSKIKLLDHYINLVEQGTNTVIPAHPWQYEQFIQRFEQRDIIKKDQIKIYLYSHDKERIINDYLDKNPVSEQKKQEIIADVTRKHPILDSPNLGFKAYIDIDRVWKDWDYLNTILIDLGIDLDRKYYEEYLDVAKRR